MKNTSILALILASSFAFTSKTLAKDTKQMPASKPEETEEDLDAQKAGDADV